MDNIIEPNETFDFSKLSLAHPAGIQGGAYFTRIEFNKKPLYIQTSKSLTRQGFVKSGKKYYSDLMFDKNAETLIHWFEKLEERCKELIYEKKDAWFQGNLEENDIENAFNPLIRIYKSGKYYLLRTNIKNTKDDTPAVKIYNENEISLTMNDIKPDTEIISILEIQGIKFTTRNFQVEIELKQVMVLDNEPIFESCLIKSARKPKDSVSLDDSIVKHRENHINDQLSNENGKTIGELEQIEQINDLHLMESEIDIDDSENPDKATTTHTEIELKQDQDLEPSSISIEFEDLNEEQMEDKTSDLKEINNDDLNLDKTETSLTLKKPNQVYFELYKEARQKAKQAKKNAIIAYLEAKNIKKTYMIENMDDSESEFDEEIDAVSESELDGL
jgi:hypothetical protein